MKVEGPKFRLWFAPDISPDEFNEAASAICRILIDPPQSPEHRRAVAVRTALAQYEGSLSGRAKILERQLKTYLAGAAWKREKALEKLPEPRSTERVLLHRLARLNEGRSLCRRRIFDIASSPQD
jgi:hypothetical protein